MNSVALLPFSPFLPSFYFLLVSLANNKIGFGGESIFNTCLSLQPLLCRTFDKL